MSRKSLPRRSTLSQAPATEDPTMDEQRLDLGNIVEIDPWKDIEKYDKQEAGQIQQVLVQFNDMVHNDKKNKRKSVEKRRSTSSTKGLNNNEALEKETTKAEYTKNDDKQNNVVVENVRAEDANENPNAEEKIVEEQKEVEEKRENSTIVTNCVEHDALLSDKKNKEKSPGNIRESSSPLKATDSTEVLEEKLKKIKSRTIHKIRHWKEIMEHLSEQDTIIVQSSDEEPDKGEEKKELEENKEKSSSEAICIEQKSTRNKRATISPRRRNVCVKTPEEQSKKKQYRKGNYEYWLSLSPNSPGEENNSTDCKRGNEGTESFENEKKDEVKLEAESEETISKEVAEKSVDDNSANCQEIQTLASPLATESHELSYEKEETSKDEPSYADCFIEYELELDDLSMKQKIMNRSFACTVLDTSDSESEKKMNDILEKGTPDSNTRAIIMKAKADSVREFDARMKEYKQIKNQIKNLRSRGGEKGSCDKLRKKFVTRSPKYESVRHESGSSNSDSNSGTSDSESSSSSSSSSSSESTSSSSSSSSSSSASSRSSRCSWCSSSSSSDDSDSSSSDSSTSDACSCSFCCGCVTDEYSEFTLGSSSSTYPGSDDTSDSSSK